jgi:hypothetical protein
VDVDRVRVRREHVAPGFARDPHAVGVDKRPSEPRQVAGEDIAGAMRRALAPDAFEELLAPNHVVGVEQKHDQYATLPSVPDVDVRGADPHLKITQQSEVDVGFAIRRRGASV